MYFFSLLLYRYLFSVMNSKCAHIRVFVIKHTPLACPESHNVNALDKMQRQSWGRLQTNPFENNLHPIIRIFFVVPYLNNTFRF